MQKLSAYSLLLSLSLMSFSLQSSTVWIFNEKTISGHIEDEIDKRIKPGKQDDAMKVELNEFKRRRKKDYIAEVERQHRVKPFKTEQDAKRFASEMAKGASNEFFDDIVKKRIAMKMASLPQSTLKFKDQFVTVARTYVENKAYQEATKTGCINETLKNVDDLINQSLIDGYGWTCELCSWLHEQ